jgi:hypothetical protein
MSWLDDLFGGGKNPADAAMPYLNKIPGETSKYLDPYFNAGTGALTDLTKQYGSLTGNPGDVINKIGGSYQQSPGYQAALKEALTAGNHAASAGGMAGTPEHQFTSMNTAADAANKDYNDWLSTALNEYNTGLSGEQGMANQGQQAGNSMADMIAQTLASQAGYSYAGQASQNQNKNSVFSNILSGIGGVAGGFPGIMDSLSKVFSKQTNGSQSYIPPIPQFS